MGPGQGEGGHRPAKSFVQGVCEFCPRPGICSPGPVTGAPAKELAAAVTKACCAEGAIVLTASVYGNVLYCLTPLGITGEQLEEGLSIPGGMLRRLMAIQPTIGV